MPKIDLEKVARFYNQVNEIWEKNDLWHSYTNRSINKFIWKILPKIRNYNSIKILNAGSGGNSYEINNENLIHVDIADSKIKDKKNFIVSNIENIPLSDNEIELIICVGSVINYCDPIKVIEEFSRILKPNGFLILEFENSKTLELLFNSELNKKATLQDTFYNSRNEKLWYYSEDYIKEILNINKLKILELERFHILSPFMYKFSKSEKFSAKFSRLDGICRMLPFFKKYSSNVILYAQKYK